MKTVLFNCKTILRFYCFYHFFACLDEQNRLLLNLLTGSVHVKKRSQHLAFKVSNDLHISNIVSNDSSFLDAQLELNVEM